MSKDEIIAQLKEENASLKELLAVALARISDLEARLKLDSTTSSKPPSSDGLNKKPAFPRTKGGRRGGKLGHKGNTLKLVEHPTREQLHPPTASVCNCGYCLDGVVVHIGEERRQVFDLPPQLLEVTEHRIGVKKCPGCGANHSGQFPRSVNAPTQYGRGVRALINLLSVEQSLPVNRIQELFEALTGYCLNQNTILRAIDRMSQDLELQTEEIKKRLLASSSAHADETGARVAGKLHWVHNLVTDRLTYFFVHAKRGIKALESPDSITHQFNGTLIHDCWPSYFKLDEQLDHAVCGAHLLRELKNLSDNHQRKWAGDFHDLLMYAYQFSDRGKGILPENKLKVVIKKYAQILAAADIEEPPPKLNKRGRPKKSKGRNLMERLLKYEAYVLKFAKEKDIPFTNNLAERDIRPWKTKLKVSGCFRTLEGAQKYARIKGFCSTVKKHRLSVYEQLMRIMEAQDLSLALKAT